MTHLPVGVIYLRGKSEWSAMFYNVHISIYNKWLEEKEIMDILRRMRNGEVEKEMEREQLSVGVYSLRKPYTFRGTNKTGFS